MEINTKKYFYEILDFGTFIVNERREQQYDKPELTSYDIKIVDIVNKLSSQAKALIETIDGNNFKYSMKTLIEIDAKISEYLFLLITNKCLSNDDVNKCIQSVEKDSLEDYYCSLDYEDILNDYKIIVYKKLKRKF